MSAIKVLSLFNKKEKPSAATNNRWLLKNTTKYEKKNFAMRRPHGYFVMRQCVKALG